MGYGEVANVRRAWDAGGISGYAVRQNECWARRRMWRDVVVRYKSAAKVGQIESDGSETAAVGGKMIGRVDDEESETASKQASCWIGSFIWNERCAAKKKTANVKPGACYLEEKERQTERQERMGKRDRDRKKGDTRGRALNRDKSKIGKPHVRRDPGN
jgi:hypothetical protein